MQASAGGGMRISWPGLVVSQVMVVLGTWLVREWGVGLWWTIVCMSYNTGYAVVYLHPPYKEPVIYLVATYAAWFVGMVWSKYRAGW